MDVKIRHEFNLTKTCREYWSALHLYWAYISIQGYFCNISLKFKLLYSTILVLLYLYFFLI